MKDSQVLMYGFQISSAITWKLIMMGQELEEIWDLQN